MIDPKLVFENKTKEDSSQKPGPGQKREKAEIFVMNKAALHFQPMCLVFILYWQQLGERRWRVALALE